MAIEISPYAFRRAETKPSFRSPMWSFLAASGVFLVLSLTVSFGAKILKDRVEDDTLRLEQKIAAARAKRNPEEVKEIRAALTVLADLKGILERHGTGENIFEFLEDVLQKDTALTRLGFSGGSDAPKLVFNFQSRSLTSSAVQIVALEEYEKGRVLSSSSTNFPVDEKTGFVQWSANMELIKDFLRKKD